MRPRLDPLGAPPAPKAVVLLLPGGRERSFDPTERRHLAGIRMVPVGWAVRRAGRPAGIGVWLLRYRYRGWNGAEMSPVVDARWAIDQLRTRHGGVPVVLVGHSMGGRTAMRVADDPAVVAVAALAPWLPDGEPVAQTAGRRLLIAHGDVDRVTSPSASRRFGERASAAGADARYVSVPGEGHALLRRWSTWHRLTADFVLDVVGSAAAREQRLGDGEVAR